MKKLSLLRLFSERIVANDDYRYKFQTLISSVLLGIIAGVMFVINVITGDFGLALVTGGLTLVGFSFSLYIGWTGMFQTVRIIIGFFYVAAIIYLLYSGSADGMAAFWAVLLPFMGFFIFGHRKGIYLALSFLAAAVIILLTPVADSLPIVYSTNYKIRFLMIYLGCVVAAFSTEYARHVTLEKLHMAIQELEGIIKIDALTGIENRRAFQERINEIWQIFHGKDNYISLLMIDIDYFKKFNDNYGHLMGDEILKEVAQILSDKAKEHKGYISRWGGEEFVCLLPFADSKEAREAGKSILKAITDAKILHEYSDFEEKILTVSIGTATVNATKGIHPRELIQGADLSLYEAKSYGRNRLGRNCELG